VSQIHRAARTLIPAHVAAKRFGSSLTALLGDAKIRPCCCRLKEQVYQYLYCISTCSHRIISFIPNRSKSLSPYYIPFLSALRDSKSKGDCLTRLSTCTGPLFIHPDSTMLVLLFSQCAGRIHLLSVQILSLNFQPS
jgi:hypothetical protein